MISPIRATPNMSVAELANVINDLANQIESENRTQVVRDENGVDRVLIGRAPKGNYVVAITIPGKNVVQELDK